MRLLIARLSNVDARYIFVERHGRDGRDICCVLYTFRVNAERNTGRDVDADSRAVADAIAGSPDFEVFTTTGSVTSAAPGSSSGVTGVIEENAATTMVLSAIVAFLCALVAF